MEYTKYNKTMVLLSEENRDFAAKSDQAIYGNLRAETGNHKGAISLSVQNLRFFERNRYVYKLILFGEKRERTIHTVIGSLILNRFGAGENYFRFDPDNIDGRGGRLEEFSTAIVAAVSVRDNKEPLHPVLTGKMNFEGILKKNEQKIVSARKESAGCSSEPVNTEEYQETNKLPDLEVQGGGQERRQERQTEQVQGHQPQQKPQNHQPQPQQKTQNHQSQQEQNRQPQQEQKPQNRQMNNRNQSGKCREKLSYNGFYNDYLRDMCGKKAKAAELYESVTPFYADKTKAVWKRVANVQNLPMVSPGAVWGATKYRHYIFGQDDKHFYFGIPGRFINEEQPEGGKSGFVLWQPIVGAEGLGATKADCSLETRMTAYGYWIAAVEKATGNIVEPL